MIAMDLPTNAQNQRGRQPPPEVVAAALDVGVAKTVCLAASGEGPSQSFHAIGVGVHSASATGAACNFEDCARAIRIAVAEAERGVQAPIDRVVAAYSGPGLASRLVQAEAKVRGGVVEPRDVQAAVSTAIEALPLRGRAVLHVIPLGYSVDGWMRSGDVRGACGRALSVDACVVTAPQEAVDALRQCIDAAGLEPAEVVAGPYAAALAATTKEERVQGVLVLDLGGGGTGVACLCADGLAMVDHIRIGGARMTRDLAMQLDTTFAPAERAKMLHGVVGGTFDPHEAIEAPRLGRDGRLESQVVSRLAFAEALAPRFREILMQVRMRLQAASLPPTRTPQRVVLLGGGARVGGAREAVQEMLGMPTRIGHPIGVADLGSARAGPAFATAAGLLSWRLAPRREARASHYNPSLKKIGRDARAAASSAWSWLKENF
jgi:cell division protein FtsA